MGSELNRWACARGVKKAHTMVYYRIYKETLKTAKKEADFIEKVLQLSKKARILDLGCGFGRHAIELAKRGFDVTATDISSDLLSIAKRNAKKAHVKIKFYQKDIRKIDFRNRFDAVIMMLNTFGLLSDEGNEKIIKNISRALKKGGKAVIDLRNPERLKKGNLYGKVEQIGKLKVYTEINRCPSRKRIMVKRYFYRGGERKEYVFVARLYNRSELKRLFSKNGLKALKFYGDFDGGEYNRGSSPRLIVIGEKK